MSENTTPEDNDHPTPEQNERAQTPPADATWVWGIVGIVVLLALVAGGIGGFIGGRLYEQSRHSGDVTARLLGAALSDQEGSTRFAVVYPGGPADLAGIQAHDELVSIAGDNVRSAAHAGRLLAPYTEGDTVLLTYRHNHRLQQAQVTLGVSAVIHSPVVVTAVVPIEPTVPPPANAQQSARLGIYYRMLQSGDPFAVTDGALIVTLLGAGTPAEQAGLQAGDIITHVGDTALSQSTTLQDALARYAGNRRVRLAINRAGETFTTTVRLSNN